MEITDGAPGLQEGPPDDMEMDLPVDIGAAPAVDEGPGEDLDWGDGDAEGFDGGFDED